MRGIRGTLLGMVVGAFVLEPLLVDSEETTRKPPGLEVPLF